MNLVRWLLPSVVAGTLMIFQVAVTPTPASGTGACELAPLELPLFPETSLPLPATPSSFTTPTADQITNEVMQGVLDQYVACINTGDPKLVWAIFSPRWFLSTFADPAQHYLPAFEQMLDNQEYDTANPIELVAIENIVPLAGGQVEITASFHSGDETWTDTLTLVLVDDQWLIDDVRLDTSAE